MADWVADDPATDADQDRGPRGTSRPCHHLPHGRGRGHRPDGARHPRRHPPPSRAAVMCLTSILPETERTRLDRYVRRSEKRRHRASMMRVQGPTRPAPGASAASEAARGEKHLITGGNQAILLPNGRPRGECRFESSTGRHRKVAEKSDSKPCSREELSCEMK
jgi:hypothetical protein